MNGAKGVSAMPIDSRIGVLNSGQHYAFVDGCEVRGTREEVEIALGLREATAPVATSSLDDDRYNVTLRFQYPAWDEKAGIVYPDILARGKADAISTARRLASDDGHTMSGKGRYWFSAEKAN
jgi:hypothetical protein